MSGTVSTSLAVATSAPCSPCMNWLTIHAWNSHPRRSRRSSSRRATGESGSASNIHWLNIARVSSSKRCSCSPKLTSGVQSMSVVAFHCDCLPFS
ncbi:MAG: hypothetical protein U5R31_13605 [Acidimicrobiia bacterium]|nr:hypothetical protein [Acidimicrobiia bacterium]